MNNISDKNVILVLFVTVIVVFVLIFSVKSPERKVIESPIMWKEEFSNISLFENDLVDMKTVSYTHLTLPTKRIV